MRRYPGCNDPPGAQLDEEQHAEGLEPDRLHREEVTGHDPRGLHPKELRPARSGVSRRRAQAVASQQGPDRRGAHPDAELAQLPADPHAAPPGILSPCRSEEHTSELQSRPHLVCRLLLEKKKTTLAHASFSITTTDELVT